jgi:hypothetical protein
MQLLLWRTQLQDIESGSFGGRPEFSYNLVSDHTNKPGPRTIPGQQLKESIDLAHNEEHRIDPGMQIEP